jgi:hypothetical protein
VKNLAKLVLFFVLCFVLVLFLAGMFGLLRDWTEKAVLFPIPVDIDTIKDNIAGTARTALPAALYITILLGLNFTAHHKIAYPPAFLVMLILSLALSAAAFAGFGRLEMMNVPIVVGLEHEGSPGLILTISPGEGRVPQGTGTVTQVVLLEASGRGSRVVSIPEQPLYYQESIPYEAGPVRLPFGDERHPVLQGIAADLDKSALFLHAWFDAGLLPFAVYAGSLSMLLISLGCLVNISFWSLANLFFGALAFRGILALEALLNSREMQGLLSAFAGNFIPESMKSLINPVLFCTLALLILAYAGLVYLARGRRQE